MVALGEARDLAELCGVLCDLDHQLALAAEGWQAPRQGGGQSVVALLGGELEALPDALFSQLTVRLPVAEQRVAGVRLRLADQPQALGGGVAFGFLSVGELVLAVEAVQFGEIHLRVVVVDEGLPVAAFRRPAQPAQLHPVDLRQVAVLGEEAFDLLVAGVLQAVGQFVVCQVRLQRIIGECRLVAHVRTTVAAGEGFLRLVVHQALLGKGGGVSRFDGRQAENHTGKQGEQSTAHGTSGLMNYGDAGTPASASISLACCARAEEASEGRSVPRTAPRFLGFVAARGSE
ncbi:hypothetical protein D3C78_900760 [compost metagenome]